MNAPASVASRKQIERASTAERRFPVRIEPDGHLRMVPAEIAGRNAENCGADWLGHDLISVTRRAERLHGPAHRVQHRLKSQAEFARAFSLFHHE